MAFDGSVIACVVKDLKDKLTGGRIVKIAQPEKDELILTIKNYDQYRLFMSADASLPLIYLTDSKKEAPLNSPAFCMLLRKHLTGARILDIVQPDFERIVNIELEHLDEMGDLCRKRLIIEIMGKHSNIIFCDEDGRIIDSIKRVPASMSSVREVLPGRQYFIPRAEGKTDPMSADEEDFLSRIIKWPGPVSKALSAAYTGISSSLAVEICFRAGIDPDTDCSSLSEDVCRHIYRTFSRLFEDIAAGSFYPNIIYDGDRALEFSSVSVTLMESRQGVRVQTFDSISSVLENFYAARNAQTRIKQKSTDLRHILTTVIERESRKYDLQLRQLKDTEKREEFKRNGELLTAYAYSVVSGDAEVTLNDYNTGRDIRIKLDPDLSPIDNAKAYYDKYNKLKRTYDALSELTVETKAELDHLLSIRTALDMADMEDDLNVIRQELADFGYVKDKTAKKGSGRLLGNTPGSGRGRQSDRAAAGRKSGRQVSRPLLFTTEDGFEIYVGKNNYQNDELTFKFANGGDWWFHAKGMPGSHVILRTGGREIPDRVYELAAAAAAYYSGGRESDKLEVDYLERKNVKKPAGARPGFVVYYTNYSMTVKPGLDGLVQRDN